LDALVIAKGRTKSKFGTDVKSSSQPRRQPIRISVDADRQFQHFCGWSSDPSHRFTHWD